MTRQSRRGSIPKDIRASIRALVLKARSSGIPVIDPKVEAAKLMASLGERYLTFDEIAEAIAVECARHPRRRGDLDDVEGDDTMVDE